MKKIKRMISARLMFWGAMMWKNNGFLEKIGYNIMKVGMKIAGISVDILEELSE